jgi:hypothetical protein
VLITATRRVLNDSLARNSLLIMATTVANGGLGYLYWMLAARAIPQPQIGTATAPQRATYNWTPWKSIT